MIVEERERKTDATRRGKKTTTLVGKAHALEEESRRTLEERRGKRLFGEVVGRAGSSETVEEQTYAN